MREQQLRKGARQLGGATQRIVDLEAQLAQVNQKTRVAMEAELHSAAVSAQRERERERAPHAA
eukprot:8708298-Alexandrium_andersonii.AAC.1